MTEINFYQADEGLSKAIAPILLKILEEKKRALIFSQNIAQINALDSGLWSYGRNKFIPHAVISDKQFDFKRQPVLLTNEEKNLNDANYLIFLDEPSSAFFKGFERVFYFFEEGSFSVAKNLAGKIKPKNSYKKEDGKWVKLTF